VNKAGSGTITRASGSFDVRRNGARRADDNVQWPIVCLGSCQWIGYWQPQRPSWWSVSSGLAPFSFSAVGSTREHDFAANQQRMSSSGLAERGTMNSPIIKRSVVLHAHKTSVSLEQPFWLELKSIAAERKVPLHRLISEIDGNRQHGNLSSALRLFVLAKYRPEAGTRPQHQGSDELSRKGPAP
jgi:predicted DNA-binding ribbon-helix-helix protein